MTNLPTSIIAVHGLYETGLKAWKHGETDAIWMLDLFPRRKYGARILSYVYDAESLTAPGGPAVTGIYDESVRLVMELVAERQLKNATRWPIIFICHGFGGLLVKRALAFRTFGMTKTINQFFDRHMLFCSWQHRILGYPRNHCSSRSQADITGLVNSCSACLMVLKHWRRSPINWHHL